MDLADQHREVVGSILHKHIPGVEVRVFGSRVNGNAKPYSDLDMALMVEESIPINTLAQLKAAFSESTLPFKVDLIEWNSASEGFKTLIDARFESIT